MRHLCLDEREIINKILELWLRLKFGCALVTFIP